MEFRVLGPLEVHVSGQQVIIGSSKQRALLTALLVNANSVVATDRLVNLLWRDDASPSARKSLQSCVARLRHRLEASEPKRLIVTRPPGYLVEIDRSRMDASRFEDLARQGSRILRRDPAGALALLDSALSLWCGPAYSELDDDVARAESSRLEELRVAAADDRAVALLAVGRTTEAIGELEAMVADRPLRDRPYGQLMVALAQAGHQVEALRVYQRYRRLLADEVGREPPAALCEQERLILEQVPSVLDVDHLQVPREALGNIRPDATSFVGREHERAEMTAALDRARIVTLVGPGGAGKSRLGLRVASERAHGYRDGVWVADLASIVSPRAVAYAVATALGVQRTHGGTIDEAVTDFLLRRQVLLVLDNCEHVLEAAGALAEAIITRCAEVTVLATSRVRLAVVDEQVWPVPPLPVPGATATSPADVGTSPAAALFIDRAQSIRPDIRLDDSAAAVGSICRDLDGLPLAIELAAARMQALTAPTLASRLSHRVGVLASGHRDDDARYRTLQAVVDWSYDLLDDTERLVFDRLSVFAGGFTLDQATDVCAGGAATSDRIGGVVASLVEKSMVLSPDGLARYRMLESLRQYGAERLTVRGENESVRQAHADTFLTLTEDANTGLQGADEGQWVARLHAELDNIRAAHAWCRRRGEAARALRLSVALHWFASCQVNDEIFSWAAAATELPGAIGDPTLPFVQGSAGVGAGRRGDLQGAVRHAMAGLAASTGPDDPARAVPLEVLADVQRFSGRLDEAVDSYSESVRLARESGDLYSVVYRLVGRALAHAYSGDLDAALASVGEIHRIATATRNPTSTAWTLYALGEVLLDADPDRALGLVEQGLEIARTVDNRFLARVALQSATSLRGRHHEPSTALSSYRDAIEHWYRHGNWTQQWITLRNLIGLLHRVGADEPAAVIYGATTSSTAAPPTIGPEAERLEAVIASLTSGLGPEQFDRAVNEGSALSDDEVVALAVSTIERA